MNAPGKGNWRRLSAAQIEQLHAMIRSGVKSYALRQVFGIDKHSVGYHREKVRIEDENAGKPAREPYISAGPRYDRVLCRHGICRADGIGWPPYCEFHKPKPKKPAYEPSTFIKPIDPARLVARR